VRAYFFLLYISHEKLFPAHQKIIMIIFDDIKESEGHTGRFCQNYHDNFVFWRGGHKVGHTDNTEIYHDNFS
jgi:hypothetical protein